MPYNIVLDSNPGFSTPPSFDPVTNEWSFDPANPLVINHVLGNPYPTDIDIETNIKNYLESLDPDIYSNIRIKGFTILLTSPITWAVLSGTIPSSSPSGYQLNEINPLTVTTTIDFQNFQLLTEGSYSGVIKFQAFADSSISGQQELIETIPYNVVLNILSPNSIILEPDTLNYSFLRDGDLPDEKDLEISTSSSWTLRTSKLITVSGTGLTDISTADETIIQGTGSKTLQIGFTAALNDVVDSTYNSSILVENTQGYSDATSVKVNILETDEFIFNPPSLSFFAIINWQEATPLNVDIFGFGAFTITHPTWLTLSETSGTDVASITVTPFSTANMGEGLYEGVITLTSGGDDYELPVSYLVVGTIYTELDKGNINFCKDINYLQIYNVADGVDPEIYNIVKIALTVKAYNYVTFLETQKTFEYELAFFNHTTKQHVGEIIERLLKKAASIVEFGINGINETNIQTLPVYKPASVDANIQIINRSSDEVIFEEDIFDMSFVAGKKPENFVNNNGVLSNSMLPKRVTTNSKEILNFIATSSFYKIHHIKNEEDPVLITTQYTGNNKLFRYSFDFSNYSEGDVVKVQVTAGTDVFTKTYIVIPEAFNSNHIAFISQYNTLELFECTGDWSITSDIKRESNKVYRDLVEVFETLSTEKEMKMFINTGFVFKHNVPIIDEIIRARKVWLMLEDNNTIELNPVDKKMNAESSDQDLYDYELEFNINRKHDVENYSL